MPRRRRDPVFEHASLMQSGVVQARMARAPRPAARATKVVARSFDDGRSITEPARAGNGPGEYDCSTANPALNATLYSTAAYGMAMGAEAGRDGELCDVAAANPSFDSAAYQNGRDAPTAPEPRAAPAEPMRRPSGSAPAPAQQPGSFEPASANTGAVAEMRKLVDDEFRADLDAILGSAQSKRKAAAASSAGAAPKRDQRPARSEPQSAAPSTGDIAAPAIEPPSEHAIFDRIAQNMRYATAYELAPVSLNRRFDSFDRQGPRRPPAARAGALSRQASGAQAGPAPSAGAGAAQPSHVPPGMPPAVPPEEPPVPATLRPYSEAERVAIYGDPRPDPESWAAANVVEVRTPQLAGVPKGDGTPSDGNVAFHKLGARSLTDLFAAWELAGLMSRVLTFDVARAAEPPHEGADAHAWAIGFDINAKWNPTGSEPAGTGREGSVRELVGIANSYGFVWGGHDPRRKAGLHFELGQRI